MSLMRCRECLTRFAVGLLRCPQCRAVSELYAVPHEGGEDMPKSTVSSGESNGVAPEAPEAPEAPVVPVVADEPVVNDVVVDLDGAAPIEDASDPVAKSRKKVA